MLDEFIERIGAEVAFRNPADGLNVAQAAGAGFDVRFQVVRRVVILRMTCDLLSDFRFEELTHRPNLVHGNRAAHRFQQRFGTGEQARCFGHVKDAVEAILRLIATPAAIGNVFNVGSDEEVTILQLAERVREAVGSSSEIRLVPYNEAYAEGFEDMLRRVPDVRRLERTIGFRPRTPLSEIITDVVADQRARLAAR